MKVSDLLLSSRFQRGFVDAIARVYGTNGRIVRRYSDLGKVQEVYEKVRNEAFRRISRKTSEFLEAPVSFFTDRLSRQEQVELALELGI